jgi:hypothetical protein
MIVKYPEWPKNTPAFSILPMYVRPSKIYPNLGFLGWKTLISSRTKKQCKIVSVPEIFYKAKPCNIFACPQKTWWKTRGLTNQQSKNDKTTWHNVSDLTCPDW